MPVLWQSRALELGGAGTPRCRSSLSERSLPCLGGPKACQGHKFWLPTTQPWLQMLLFRLHVHSTQGQQLLPVGSQGGEHLLCRVPVPGAGCALLHFQKLPQGLGGEGADLKRAGSALGPSPSQMCKVMTDQRWPPPAESQTCCPQVPGEGCWPLEGDSLCTQLLTIQCGTEKLVSGCRCIQLKMKHVRVEGAGLGCSHCWQTELEGPGQLQEQGSAGQKCRRESGSQHPEYLVSREGRGW